MPDLEAVIDPDASVDDEIHRWRLHMGECSPIELYLSSFSADGFDDAEYERSAIYCPESIRRSVPKRRAEYFYGRLMARAAVRAWGGPDVDILSGPLREPIWPQGLVGSISHTDCQAVAIVLPRSRFNAIGVDIERVSLQLEDASLHSEIFAPAEVAYLEKLAGRGERSWLFTTAFSAKESFFKAACNEVGTYFGFDALAIKSFAPGGRWMELVVTHDLSPALKAGHLVRVRVVRLDAQTVLTACMRESSAM